MAKLYSSCIYTYVYSKLYSSCIQSCIYTYVYSKFVVICMCRLKFTWGVGMSVYVALGDLIQDSRACSASWNVWVGI